jgi:PhzF family phenazine biosynthesis protein
MHELPIYQVDAFSSALFGGNPAAVCPLDAWLPDATMQRIAAENNLSETAFFVPEGDGYALRWFTPVLEVDLCGHATLASGFVVLEELAPGSDGVVFDSPRSGRLPVRRDGERLSLDFPAQAPEPHAADARLSAALGRAPAALMASRDTYLAIYETADAVRALAPDMRALHQLGGYVIATAPGAGDVDFVSRFFAPRAGIDEDPVTGSAHCVLAPYWASRLGKTSLYANQVSRRGGELWLTLDGARVHIAGHARLYMRGTIYLP